MKISYEVKRAEMKIQTFGCYARCCWRFNAGAKGEI